MEKASCVLVCVTVQRACDRLIRRGEALAKIRNAPLVVIHVSRDKALFGNPEAADALNYLFSLAHDCDAQMEILTAKDIPGAIAKYALSVDAGEIITGPDKSGMVAALTRLLPDVSITAAEET